MPAAVEALQLVNRVLLRGKRPVVGDVVDSPGLNVLHHVNSAIRDVLYAKDWDFDIRHDGELLTQPLIEGTAASFSNGSTQFLYTDNTYSASNWYGDFSRYIVVTSDGSYGATAFRIDRTTSPPGVIGNLATAWPGTTALGTSEFESFVAEYTLPTTVRSVIKASIQETPLDIEAVDPNAGFAEWHPKPHEEYNPPRKMAWGGSIIPTHTTGEDPEPSMRAMFWPVPDQQYLIRYSYQYRHPELSAADDKLRGVPEEVVDRIVDVAHAFFQQNERQDLNDGVTLERVAKARANDRRDSRMPAKRHVVDPVGGRRRTSRFYDWGFPGETLTK